MSLQESVSRPQSRESARPDGRLPDQMVEPFLSNLAYFLWPTNTAPELATAIQRAGGKCEVRSAERYLAGDRDWSGDAVAALVAEILHRHAVRNIKVTRRE